MELKTFEQFEKELIHYSSKVCWIDSKGNKQFLYSKSVILNNSGDVDVDRQIKLWADNNRKCYKYTIKNRPELITITN